MSLVRSGTGTIRTALIEVGKRSASAQYELVHLAADLDDSGEWVLDGAATAAHWIASALEVEVCTGREWVRIGRLLRTLPLIDAAFASGELSYSKVRILTRLASPQNEAQLLPIAMMVPAGRLRMELASWSHRHEDPADRSARHQRHRGLWWQTEADGSVTGRFCLPPVEAGSLAAATDALVMQRSQQGRRGAPADAPHLTLAQQRADALIELVTGGGASVCTEVILHVRADGCSLDDGTPVGGSLIEGLVSSAFLRVLIHDAERHPINASGRHRHPTDRQKRVVKERDRVCVDCGATDLLQYDHVPDFDDTRRTLVDELQLRCSRCHRLRHKKR